MVGVPNLKPTVSDRFLAELSGKYRDVFRRYFYRHVKNHAEAEDLTQELFVRVLRKSDLGNVAEPDAYLFRAATNLLRDRGRRSKTSGAFLAEMSATFRSDTEDLSPERVLKGKQTLQMVLRALDGIDPKTRHIFVLNRLEGMKYAEIAQLLGISVSAVEKHMTKCIGYLVRYANDQG